MERPYHPALARMAAQHDEIMLEFRAGMLSDSAARRRVVMLAARDDSGVEWSIDPDTGAWRFRNPSGGFSYASPPALGALPSLPSDVGSQGFRPGSDRVTMHEVPEHLSPRHFARDPEALGGTSWLTLVLVGALAIVLLALAAALIL